MQNNNASSQWSVNELLEIAKCQRAIIYMILLQFAVIAVVIITAIIGRNMPDAVLQIVGLATLIIRIAAVVLTIYFVYKIAAALNESTVLFIILMFVPLLSLIALLVLNSKANNILQKHEIKVGLMGADQSDLDRLRSEMA